MQFCTACGRHSKDEHRFCADCGNSLTKIAAPSGDGATRPVVHERKFVTVLFADLCDSTQLISDADCEEAQNRLGVAIAAMSEAIEGYGGTISQLLGDGVLALFGAPVTQEDHALRACLAAIAIQQGLRARAIGTHRPLVRVGLHSGEVVVGSANQYLSSHYRADGSTLHIAARLEKMARPGTVLLTGDTLRHAGDGFEFESMGVHAIRGLPEARELFALVTTGQRSAVAPLARRSTLGPLVGRERSLAQLRTELAECLGGSLRVVGLKGEAGMGKSRLLASFGAELGEQGVRRLSIAPRACSTHVAYDLVSQIVRRLMDLDESPDPARQRAAAVAKMAQWPSASHVHQGAVHDLLGIAQEDGAWKASTPAQRQQKIAEALGWLLEWQAERGPVALLLDDLHEADRASVGLIDQVVPRLRRLPVLVLAGYRPEFAHRWSGQPWFVEHWVDPLSAGEMNQLARALLGPNPSVESMKALVVERADGNPFFLEQLIMTLIDDFSLVGAPGDYRCSKPAPPRAVPVSIAAVISARVDRLEPAAKATLEAAAIVGETFSAATIAAMQQLDADEIAGHLALAVAAGLLRPRGADRESAYVFRHALVHEVVDNALTRVRRMNLHRAAFIALHGRPAGDPEQFPLLARHAHRGGLWLEAAAYSLKSMGRLIARSANRDALAMFELGLEAVAHQEEGDAAMLRAELKLRMKALGALMPSGRPAVIIDNLERATYIAQRLADPRSEAAATLQLVFVQWVRGDYRRGLEVALTADASAAASGNRMLRMAATQARVLLCHGLGRYGDVLRDARAAQTEYAAELSQHQLLPGWAVHPACNVLIFMADCLWRMADFEAAQEALDACYHTLGQNEHLFTRLVADCVQGELWIARGRAADAEPLLGRSLALCRSHDVPSMVPPLLALHCVANARLGRAEEAFATLARANDEKVYLAGGRYNAYYFPRGLALCLIGLGRHTEALQWARAARAAAEASEQNGHAIDAEYLEGSCLAALGQRAAALDCLRRTARRAAEAAMHHTATEAEREIERLCARAPEDAGSRAWALPERLQ